MSRMLVDCLREFDLGLVVKHLKWMIICILALSAAGCGNQPKPDYTPDGFDPPYDYY
jgi:hypothetical protein